MGELIFSLSYGGALIVIGLVARAFIRKMESETSQADSREQLVPPQQKINL